MTEKPLARLQRALDIVDRFQEAPDIDALDAHARSAFGEFGLTGFMAAQVKFRGEQLMSFLRSDQDAEWKQRYLAQGYDRIDPIIKLLKRRTGPILWSELDRRDWSAMAMRLVREADEFGYRDGVTFPWHAGRGSFGAVGLMGPEPELRDGASRSVLRLVAYAYAERAQGLSAEAPGQGGLQDCPLTQRQLDCLAWAAEGKTDWEISQILHIAEGTVARHFENARERLGVPTRVQAVVIALLNGWLPATIDYGAWSPPK